MKEERNARSVDLVDMTVVRVLGFVADPEDEARAY